MGKVLVRGAAIHATNGLRFDSNDRLYIACIMGREIVVMDTETGEIIDRLGTDVGVESPSDLVFGPEGTPYEGYLYFTSLLTGEVRRLSPDGVKTQYVGLGTSPITFSHDGSRLFVALDFMGDALYELDPNLKKKPRLIAEGLGWFQAMDFGPDGYLYGPIWTQGKVVRIDIDSCKNSSSPYTDCDIETVTDGLGVPAAVKFDSKGRLYVNDTLRGEVLRVDTETGDKKVIATLEPGLDNLAFDSKDQLFVSSFTDGFIIQVFSENDDCDDEPCRETRIVSRGGMISPLGVAVLPSPRGESVFVGDFQSLREYDGRTGNLMSIERNLLIPGIGITTPSTVAADGENLILSTWFGSAVQVWNPQTRVVVEEYFDFYLPQNAIRFQGDLVVAELLMPLGQSKVVRRIEGTGEHVTLASGLYVPAGLAATEDDLWVSDWATGIVWQIVIDREISMIPVAMGLSSPEGLAVDLDGNLLVIESGAKQLSRINLETGVITVLVEGLEINAEGPPNYPPNWGFNGVAVGPSGYIYITGNVTNVLYRFKPTADLMREG
ncbi:MAG: hypothetical protein GTO13_18180 [Proteobacteria bacterium]|nr:hypothetical protein [Pseudomonadota bacterium]